MPLPHHQNGAYGAAGLDCRRSCWDCEYYTEFYVPLTPMKTTRELTCTVGDTSQRTTGSCLGFWGLCPCSRLISWARIITRCSTAMLSLRRSFSLRCLSRLCHIASHRSIHWRGTVDRFFGVSPSFPQHTTALSESITSSLSSYMMNTALSFA